MTFDADFTARRNRRHRNAARVVRDPAVRVNGAPTGTRVLRRSDALRDVAAAPFINSKPQCGLPVRGESPLSDTAACCMPDDGVVMGGLFDRGEMAPCAF
jgi:hypothetical protein